MLKQASRTIQYKLLFGFDQHSGEFFSTSLEPRHLFLMKRVRLDLAPLMAGKHSVHRETRHLPEKRRAADLPRQHESCPGGLRGEVARHRVHEEGGHGRVSCPSSSSQAYYFALRRCPTPNNLDSRFPLRPDIGRRGDKNPDAMRLVRHTVG